MNFKIHNECLCVESKQNNTNISTGEYTPVVFGASGNFFKEGSIVIEKALYTKINNIVSVYGTFKADYAEQNQNSVGTLQLEIPSNLSFDSDEYAINTLGNATLSGGQSGSGPVTGVFLQSHAFNLTGLPEQQVITLNIATTNDFNVDSQINVPFTYSYTYKTNVQ